jgi:hypothetical protein
VNLFVEKQHSGIRQPFYDALEANGGVPRNAVYDHHRLDTEEKPRQCFRQLTDQCGEVDESLDHSMEAADTEVKDGAIFRGAHPPTSTASTLTASALVTAIGAPTTAAS